MCFEIKHIAVQPSTLRRVRRTTALHRSCTDTGPYNGPMFFLGLILWLAFCAALACTSVRAREGLLLGTWALLALPLLASLGRLFFA